MSILIGMSGDDASQATQVARLRRQAVALADFGQHAIRSSDLDALLQEASAQVSEVIDIDLVKVLELLPGGQTMLIRAGVNWNPGIVGHARVDSDHGSPAGYALQTGQPVISRSVASECRFEIPNLLIEHGVQSMINVVIKGEKPFGVLEVDSRQSRDFDENDVSFLQNYANLLAAAIDRLRKDAELHKAMEERRTLLRELQHRVKNNLQVMISMLNLQIHTAVADEARQQLNAVRTRFEALCLVHDQLYAGEETGTTSLDEYLRKLVGNLVGLHGDAPTIQLDLQLDRTSCALEVAVPVGLIVNEFITNSLRHAFPDRTGSLIVRLEIVDGCGKMRLLLADDGIGMPRTTDRGLGLQLIKSLIRQIGGTSEWSEAPGTRLEIIFTVA